MFTIWRAYLVAALSASGLFIVAGWRSRHSTAVVLARARHGLLHDPLLDEAESDLSAPELRADAGVALRVALKRLIPLMANRSVQVELAAGFGLLVKMRGAALVELLEEVVAAVIQAAPASRILTTAAAQDDCIRISVTDDIPNANLEVRRAGVRGLQERVAMRGGALEIAVQPSEGTTMTLILASADEEDGYWAPLDRRAAAN